MRSRLRGSFALLALLTCAAFADAQSAADVAAARSLFTQGTELAKAGKLDDARDRFERSLKLKRAGITLYSLGVVQKKLGLAVEASESFRAFLAEPPLPQTKAFEDPARDAVAELSKTIASLRVTVTPAKPPELHVRVDGQEIPEAARIVPREVNPGKHHVEVLATGFRMSASDVTLGAGESRTLEVTLAPQAVTSSLAPPPAAPSSAPAPVDTTPPPASAPPPSPPPSSASPNTLPFVIYGASGAVILASVVVGAMGVSQAKNAPTRDGTEADSARTKGTISDVLLGIGLAGAAVGTYFLLTSHGETSAARVDAKVTAYGEGATAGLRVLF